MSLLSDNMNNQLDELFGKCFAINRKCDRAVSLLNVRFTLIKTGYQVHYKIAHAFLGSLFADSIGDYKSSRNAETKPPATPIGDAEYVYPIDFFIDLHNECIELQNMIYDTTDSAIEEGDHSTKTFLDGLTQRLVVFTDLSQNLIDLFSKYGNDTFKLQVLDGFIEKYFPD